MKLAYYQLFPHDVNMRTMNQTCNAHGPALPRLTFQILALKFCSPSIFPHIWLLSHLLLENTKHFSQNSYRSVYLLQRKLPNSPESYMLLKRLISESLFMGALTGSSISNSCLVSQPFQLKYNQKQSMWFCNNESFKDQIIAIILLIFIKMNLRWSTRLKHPDIEIKGKKIIRTAKQVYSPFDSICIVAEPALNPQSKQLQKWRLKIIGNIDWIVYGICNLSSITASRFQQQSWAQLGHGNYIVTNHGDVYSTSDLRQNYTSNSEIRAGEGDVLEFQYEPMSSLLTITKYGQQNNFQLSLEEFGKDTYYPCVYFQSVGGAVEIFDQT